MGRPDLSKFAFTRFDDFQPWIDKDEARLWDFQERVEAVLDRIPPGGQLDVLQVTRPENYQIFTLVADYYMEKEFLAKGLISNRTYYRDDNYTVIARLNLEK